MLYLGQGAARQAAGSSSVRVGTDGTMVTKYWWKAAYRGKCVVAHWSSHNTKSGAGEVVSV